MSLSAEQTAYFDDLTNSAETVLFMKGTQDFPMCGFSARVVQILNHLSVDFKDINILEDENIRQGMKLYSDWPTFPQLYVKGELVGGCDIISEMFEAGELTALFQNQ